MMRWFTVMSLVGLVCGCDRCGEAGAGARSREAERRTDRVDGYDVVAAEPVAAASRVGVTGLIRTPNQPDPAGGEFSLEQAVTGMPVDGQLVAEIRTDLGTLLCDLFSDEVPGAVANFVGLARGLRPWWDPRSGEWTRGRALYDETSVSRVLPGQFIHLGDRIGDGSGWVGYELEPDESSAPRLDRAGQMVMWSRPSGAYGGQFIITDGVGPDLGGSTPVFGQCSDPSIVERIARVPQGPDNRPLTAVRVHRVVVRRVVGGAADAEPLRPGLPADGSHRQPRGASPSPTELDLDTQIQRRRGQTSRE